MGDEEINWRDKEVREMKRRGRESMEDEEVRGRESER